jgi:hypothetical protein
MKTEDLKRAYLYLENLFYKYCSIDYDKNDMSMKGQIIMKVFDYCEWALKRGMNPLSQNARDQIETSQYDELFELIERHIEIWPIKTELHKFLSATEELRHCMKNAT